MSHYTLLCFKGIVSLSIKRNKGRQAKIGICCTKTIRIYETTFFKETQFQQFLTTYLLQPTKSSSRQVYRKIFIFIRFVALKNCGHWQWFKIAYIYVIYYLHAIEQKANMYIISSIYLN